MQGTGLHTADARMHAMAIGLSGPPCAPSAIAPGRHAVASGIQQQHPGQSQQQQQQLTVSASPPEVSGVGGTGSPMKGSGTAVRPGSDGQQAASGNRSDNNSSESIQTSGAACPTVGATPHLHRLFLLPLRAFEPMPLPSRYLSLLQILLLFWTCRQAGAACSCKDRA